MFPDVPPPPNILSRGVANPQVFGPAAAERAGTHPVSDNRCIQHASDARDATTPTRWASGPIVQPINNRKDLVDPVSQGQDVDHEHPVDRHHGCGKIMESLGTLNAPPSGSLPALNETGGPIACCR
jgi:hypothetical protein